MKIMQRSAPKRSLPSKRNGWIYISIGLVCLAFLLFLISFFVLNHWKVEMTIPGENTQVVEYDGSEYKVPEAEAVFHGSLVFKKGLPLKVRTINAPDGSQLGEFDVTYRASCLFWYGEQHRTVIIQDTTAPELVLNGESTFFVPEGTDFEEPGFTASDAFDGDLTDKVEREETEDAILYTVTDSSGNTATAQRSITRKDIVAPVILLKGEEKMTISAGDEFTDPGCTAEDNMDGDLTGSVKVKGSVNPLHADTYTLSYTVSDEAGNKTTVKRTVTVEPIRQEDGATADEKVVYLTFDDGPSPHTRQLLDVLAAYNVKATFFTCKTPNKALIKDEFEEGHTVAIHSATHDYKKIYASKEAYFKDLQVQADLIYKYTGQYTTLVRFPGGSSNTVSRNYCTGIMAALAKELPNRGYQYFDWNVLSGDAGETESTDEVVKNVIAGMKAHDPAVVLQHDTEDFSVNAVERILIWGIQNGYTFLPLEPDSFPAHHPVIAN